VLDKSRRSPTNTFGYFLGDFIVKVGEGSYIIISYAILIFIVFKLFPLPKADEAKNDQAKS
jgi:hypothetical protein